MLCFLQSSVECNGNWRYNLLVHNIMEVDTGDDGSGTGSAGKRSRLRKIR